MYFKRLELIGFKSFADKTLIEFEPGVTAVVGPNGCGKSNIADAVRWVLGEQSAKSLRGGSMEDVIFNGSSLKEPLNVAEVSLTLSNQPKILPIDYDEVTLTRRLYRSGESEYLINRNPVRLRDVNELLMGTGIGTESYSLIEQGRMDVVLNSKPEDRRALFEEAAGITKYKSKKKEALRKLEQTGQNLLRVNDIIQEVKRQIGSIERQAKKAEAYKVEFEKLKNLELAAASREFLLFQEKKRASHNQGQALRAQEAEFNSKTQEVEERCLEIQARINELDGRLAKAATDEIAASAEIRKAGDRALLNRERMGDLGARKEQLLKQAQIASGRKEEFEAEARRLDEQFKALENNEGDASQILQTAEADFAAAQGAVGQLEEELEGMKGRFLEIARERAQNQSELAKNRAQSAALAARLRRLKAEEEDYLREIREADKSLRAPLFEFPGGAEKSVGLWLDARIGEFKDRIRTWIQSLFERRRTEWGPGEDAELEAHVRGFSGEILKIQGQTAEQESRLRHVDQTKRKLEEKLSVILAETGETAEEQSALNEKEKELAAAGFLVDEDEKALEARWVGVQAAAQQKVREKEAFLVRLAEIRSRQVHSSAAREKLEKDRIWAREALGNEETQGALLESQMQEASSKKEALEKECVLLEEEAARLSVERDELLRGMEGLKRRREEAASERGRFTAERDERQAFLNGVRDKVHAFELEHAQVGFEIDRLTDRIFNAYQVDLLAVPSGESAAGAPQGAWDLERAKTDIQAQREKLNKMGSVNLVAIEEYEEMRGRYDFLTKQQADLLQSKEDLHAAILKINRTTRELFSETFEKVQKNFTEYYRLLFGGGTAELILLDENDVLESGIEIVARPPGKKLQSISLLSGGEKALTAIALLFALFKVKPSPFCVLDEIDAPLDESNVDRFCRVLREFIAGSQFILITHNKRTMHLADALYGITMAETGVTKIVSVRFSETNGRGAAVREKSSQTAGFL